MKKIFLFIAVLILAVGCSSKKSEEQTDFSTAENIGEGSLSFFLEVDSGDDEAFFNVKTDDTTVGTALLNLGIISGEESSYGLYITTVNGKTADYDKDKTYWSFYVDGEYAQTGADSTEIKDGSTYSFKLEK
ncbi:MAG: DUF4430 domain-containing protein [Clostridiales bacterium]|jgi:hypothetical protein|nr:DUF4430 domain-containing protein [Clostridiales bacterium]